MPEDHREDGTQATGEHPSFSPAMHVRAQRFEVFIANWYSNCILEVIFVSQNK